MRRALWELLRPPLQGVAAVLLVAVGCAVIYGHVILWRNTVEDRDAQDFGIFLNSARTFAAGGSLYPAGAVVRNRSLYSTGQLNLNLPHTHLLLLPLTGLTPGRALTVWFAASLTVFVLCAWTVCRALVWQLPPLLWLAIVVYLLAWGATAAFSLTAQLSLLLAGPVTAAWVAARQQRNATAGAWLGLAAVVKPFLFVFVPYLAITRNWRALRTMGTVATIRLQPACWCSAPTPIASGRFKSRASTGALTISTPRSRASSNVCSGVSVLRHRRTPPVGRAHADRGRPCDGGPDHVPSCRAASRGSAR